MTFKLYDGPFPGTRATRVRWMLEEVGAPYELVKLDFQKGEHKGEAYLAKHPHGRVPAAELDGVEMIESAAMCMHLADAEGGGKLAPELGSVERAKYYQWIVYAVATLDGPLVSAILNTMVFPPDRRDPAKVKEGKATWDAAAPFLERTLEGNTWICGDAFSAADVVIGYDIHIAKLLGWIADGSQIAAYAARLDDRPAFQRAYAR